MNKQTKLNSNYLLYLFDFMYFDTLYSGTELFQGECLISKNNAYFLRVEENGYFSVYASSHFHPLNRISSIDKEKQLNKGEPPYTLKLTHEGVIEINDSKNIEILQIHFIHGSKLISKLIFCAINVRIVHVQTTNPH